jgi:DNA modification methylase
VELMERAILHSSQSGDLVLDTFAGSGSTLIACQRTSRCGRMIELDPRYVDASILRWQAFSGQQATLASTAQTFEDVWSGNWIRLKKHEFRGPYAGRDN